MPGLSLGAPLELSWSSPGALVELSWSSPGALLGLSWSSPAALVELPWSSPGLSWSSSGALLELPWSSPGAPLQVSRSSPGILPELPWSLSRELPCLAYFPSQLLNVLEDAFAAPVRLFPVPARALLAGFGNKPSRTLRALDFVS